MKIARFIVPVIVVALAACSETPVEEQSEEVRAEMEKQIQTDANSLEEAAAEAVTVLEQEIDAELANDGVSAPSYDDDTRQQDEQ